MPFPPLPSPLTFEKAPELVKVKEQLSKGEISLEEAEASIITMAQSFAEKEKFSSAAELPSMKQRESNNIFFSIYEGDDEHNQSLFLEDSGDDADGSGADNETVLEQRLGHVEHMLQSLMNQITPSTFHQHQNQNQNQHQQHPQQTSLIRAPPIRASTLVTSGTSMISALSNSDHVSAVQQQNDDTRDKDELMKEIDYLKRQLDIAKQTNTFTIRAEESESTISSSMIRAKKKKRKLKKPWK